ncbi:lipase member H-B-like isoform X2 [Colias croceus]|uniref:lipase member H-B-like isoform X2 n=1 Tax=Colias crocea TaxID=72248 RepID=UPI001E27D389|nr:lipase member H-B-like isoform X2 [Colias croceus]
MLAIIVVFCLLSICNVSTMYSSKYMEGYPHGFLADCPGSNQEAIITKRSLKYLTMTVANSDKVMPNKYSFYQMKDLALDPNIDFRRNTVLYIGGYLDSPSFIFARNMGAAYKDLGYNVLLLDTNMFTTMQYPRAARFMRPVGKNTAKMLAELTTYGLDPKKLELVGISLGAQTASFIAKHYKKLTGHSISRLTGLDPAGPCFRNLGPEERIDKSDADFVEMVATNIDGYGMAAPVGHVNFYVNGGEFQPGDLIWTICDVICSHLRSYYVWMAALRNPNSFIGLQCDSVQAARDKNCYERQPRITNVLGLNCDKTKEGIFYLNTNNTYPYYLGKKGLSKEHEFVLSKMNEINAESIIKM